MLLDLIESNKWLYNFQATPHWINRLLPRLHAGNVKLQVLAKTLLDTVNILLSAVAKYDAKYNFLLSCRFLSQIILSCLFLSFQIAFALPKYQRGWMCSRHNTNRNEMIEKTRSQSNRKGLCRKSESGKEYL